MRVFLDVLLSDFLIAFSVILCVSAIILVVLDYIFDNNEKNKNNSNKIDIDKDKTDSDLIDEIGNINLIPFDRTIKGDDNINNMF